MRTYGSSMLASMFVMVSACSSDQQSGATLDAPPQPPSTTLKRVEATTESRETSLIESYDVYPLSKGMFRAYAKDERDEVRAVVDIRALDDAGTTAAAPVDTVQIELTSVYPAEGTRTIRVADNSVVENSAPRGSEEDAVLEAVQRDLSEGNESARDSARMSADPSTNPKAFMCFTQTKCRVVVMTCQDKCCNGWTYDDRGRIKYEDCTNDGGQYVCGACIGFDW